MITRISSGKCFSKHPHSEFNLIYLMHLIGTISLHSYTSKYLSNYKFFRNISVRAYMHSDLRQVCLHRFENRFVASLPKIALTVINVFY